MYRGFGEWLRTARRRRKITQKALGERIGYSNAYISILENARPHSETGGDIRPSEDFIEKVAAELRVDEAEGRVLAGYNQSPVIPTLKEAQEMLRQGGAVLIDPRPGQTPVTVIDKAAADQIAQALVRIFRQSEAETNTHK